VAQSPQLPAFHAGCGSDEARLLADRTRAERFFVFTDDPAWVRAEVRLPGTTVLVSLMRHAAGGG